MLLLSRKSVVSSLLLLAFVVVSAPEAIGQVTKGKEKKPAVKKTVKPKATNDDSASESVSSGRTTASAGDVKLEVVGLAIGKELPKPEDEDSSKKPSFGGSFGMMNVQPGTELTIHFAGGKREFVRLDDKASKITSFMDDKGTDLTGASTKTKAKSGGIQFGSSQPLRAEFAEDRHSGTLRVFARDQRPATGATKITLKAEAVFKCGAGEKTAEQAEVKFKKGTKITAGPVPMTIEQVEPSSFNDDYKMTISLQAKAKLDSIKKIAFFDASGKEIKSAKGGESSFTFAGSTQVDRGYMLAEKVDSATIKITYFEKLEDVVVPVEITTGVGF